MKKPDFKKGWMAFLHWMGWKATASFFVGICRWSGWKVLFGLPIPWLGMFCIGCTVGLIWVFANDRMEWVPAYFLYAFSAYTLTAVCVKFPALLRAGKGWFSRHPKLAGFLKEETEKIGLKLNIQKTKIMASNPITSWQIDGETVETAADCFLGLQNHCRW